MSRAGDAIAAYRARTVLPLAAQAGMAAVAGAAAVTSFDGLRALAERCGTPYAISFLLPVAVDAAAAVATLVWLTSTIPAVITEARRLAWTAIVLSVLGNAAEHAFSVLQIVPPPVYTVALAALVGAVAPAIFGAVVHLAVAASRGGGPVTTLAAGHGAVTPRPMPVVAAGAPDAGGDAADRSSDDTAGQEKAPVAPREALEGTKISRARAFYRWQRSLGVTPSPADVNMWIDSANYVKPGQLEQWEQELTRERLSVV